MERYYEWSFKKKQKCSNVKILKVYFFLSYSGFFYYNLNRSVSLTLSFKTADGFTTASVSFLGVKFTLGKWFLLLFPHSVQCLLHYRFLGFRLNIFSHQGPKKIVAHWSIFSFIVWASWRLIFLCLYHDITQNKKPSFLQVAVARYLSTWRGLMCFNFYMSPSSYIPKSKG